MDHPDLMSPLNSGNTFYQEAFSSERDYSNAVREAVKLHCKGQYIPDDVARFCRELAVNLDRDLARTKGDELPKLAYLTDFTL